MKSATSSPTIGQRIFQLRKEKGWSQQQLELEAGINFGTISRFETDKINPTKETLLKISLAMKLPPKEQALLLGISYKPAIYKEFQEVFPHLQPYLEECDNPAGLSDICGFMWIANKPMLQLFQIDQCYWNELLREKKVHILEWLMNPQLPAYRLIPDSRRDDIFINQTILFMFLIDYPKRKNEMWIKELLNSLQKFPDFTRIWQESQKFIQSKNAMLFTINKAIITFTVDGKPNDFIIHNTYINQFPQFLIAEFIKRKI